MYVPPTHPVRPLSFHPVPRSHEMLALGDAACGVYGTRRATVTALL